MVQMTGVMGSTQSLVASPIQARDTGTLDRYRADWQAPAATATASAPRNVAADPARTHRNAQLAADVYEAMPNPPAGTRVANAQDLEKLNLTPTMLERPGSSFRARVYVSGPAGQEQYTVAFRGTQNGADWRANFQQGTGQDTTHYRMALAIGREVARSGAAVEMTGHSLGGGLASAAALASGRHADTFNAAGLHDATVARATGIAANAGRAPGAVDNYRVPGEILTFVQEGGDRLAGGLLGGLAGAIVVDAPPAYGRQHALAGVVPDHKSWFAEHSRIDRHGMDWVLASTGTRLGR